MESLTMHSDDNGIIKFNDLNDIEGQVEHAQATANDIIDDTNEFRNELAESVKNMESLASEIGVIFELPKVELGMIDKLNSQLDSVLETKNEKFKKLPKLKTEEALVATVAGLVSVIVDVIFVGTPEVVKIYKGGKNFDGSILTKQLRKIAADENSTIALITNYLSDKCKVPYDIAAMKNVVYPENHRLRSLGHDPFLGLVFAVADILMGTTTCIDNEGMLRVLVNSKSFPECEKPLSVFYYLGHIISDMFTTCGIPIPGFFLTQFFTKEIKDNTLAKIAEDMYKDGYDLRHLASMSVPHAIQKMIIDIYLSFRIPKEDICLSISEKEVQKLNTILKREKIMFIANSIAVCGNLAKFFAPPTSGNPCSLNIVQWYDFLISSIIVAKAELRDSTTEELIENRKNIEENWKELSSLFCNV